MKKILAALIVLLIVISMMHTTEAKADVLWEPTYNFFDENKVDYTIERRSYIANSPNGFVNIYKSPDSKTTTGVLLNGDSFYVYYKGEYDGKLWGLNTQEEYVLLDNMYVAYDHISFEEEYKDKIEDLSDARTELKKGYLYMEYPGAERCEELMFDNKEAYCSKMFVDEQGLEWRYFGYVYGLRNFWVCVSDPYNRDYVKREVSVPTLYSALTPTDEEIKTVAKEENDVKIMGSKRGKTIVVACICTAAVVFVAAYMITRRLNGAKAEKEE